MDTVFVLDCSDLLLDLPLVGATCDAVLESPLQRDNRHLLKQLSAEQKAEQKAQRALLPSYVERSRKAFGAIFNALSDDLRLQVAHLPQGWANGLWLWLERKYQSTDPDNVASLLMEWMSMQQDKDESFDQYRARVTKLLTLLEHAKEQQSPQMVYVVTLLRLRPKYKPAVLALQNGSMLQDMANIDWNAVTQFINAHERSGRQFAEVAAASGAKAMSARDADATEHTPASSVSQPQAHSLMPERSKDTRGDGSRKEDRRTGFIPMEERQCYTCSKYGHISRYCPQAQGHSRGAGGSQQQRGGFSNQKRASRHAPSLAVRHARTRCVALHPRKQQKKMDGRV